MPVVANPFASPEKREERQRKVSDSSVSLEPAERASPAVFVSPLHGVAGRESRAEVVRMDSFDGEMRGKTSLSARADEELTRLRPAPVTF